MILAVRDVSAGYGTVPVLRNISFTQQYGEVLGVVGHNGMGKTTSCGPLSDSCGRLPAQLSLMASRSRICPPTVAALPVSVFWPRSCITL